MAEASSWDDIVEIAENEKLKVILPPGGEQPEELFFLCGWWGAKMKHLLKYSELCQSLRPQAATLLCIASDFVRSPMQSLEFVAAKAWKVLTDVADVSPGIPTWLYYFSNGGVLLHEKLLKRLGNHGAEIEANLKLKGIIYDSAPAYPTAKTLSRAINNGNDSFLLYLGAVLLVSFSFLVGTRNHFWDNIKNSNLNIPELYLYSFADRVTDVKMVEELAEERRLGGIPVTRVRFDESAHVSHYRRYREKYANALDSFMDSH